MIGRLLAAPRRRPLSAMTVKHVHATLRTALNAAVRRRLIPYNPALPIELPEVRRTQVLVWTPDQVRTFLAAASSDRLYALFHLVVMTGLRRGEVCGLRWADVDLERQHLRVAQQLLQLGGQTHIGALKTRAEVRTVPLDPGTVEVLREHRQRQSDERRAWGTAWTDTGLVFTREDGTLVTPATVSRRFGALTRAAGLPSIRFHGLRHTSASTRTWSGRKPGLATTSSCRSSPGWARRR